MMVYKFKKKKSLHIIWTSPKQHGQSPPHVCPPTMPSHLGQNLNDQNFSSLLYFFSHILSPYLSLKHIPSLFSPHEFSNMHIMNLFQVMRSQNTTPHTANAHKLFEAWNDRFSTSINFYARCHYISS